MKIKVSLFLVFISCVWWLSSFIIEIKQDGTGDFITIQQGINASLESDTVLVFTGTYFENIDFIGKSITVASLYINIEDNTHIHNTIIDGNNNGSCVKFVSGEDDNSILNGFTVQNGSGTPYQHGNHDLLGGGIYFLDTFARIENCIIQNNEAYDGGGIFISATWETGFAKPYLKNCTIRNNHAYYYGGGIGNLHNSSLEFDQNDLCNIYANYAAYGNDIVDYGIDVEPMEVFVDTFTVFDPDNFFFFTITSSTFNCSNSKIIPINQDIYVSPEGDNNNSGLDPDEPLETIAMAYIKIASDSLHPNTIHLAEGIYSPSINNEKYPLNSRSYISLVGAGIETSFLDAENSSSIFYAFDYEQNYKIQDLSFINSNFNSGALKLYQPINLSMENLRFNNNFGDDRAAISSSTIGADFLDSTSLNIKNVEIINNVGGKSASFGVIENVMAENLLVKNNIPNYEAETVTGGGIVLGGHYLFPDRFNFSFINTEITENIDGMWEWPNTGAAIAIYNRVNISLINCTIGSNEALSGAAIEMDFYDIDLNIINSILYGDNPREIYINDPYYPNEQNTLTIRNSLIDGGEEGIYVAQGDNIINWLDGNLDDNPDWLLSGDYPYSLSSSSPCIDAGTLDLPEGIELPEYDLAGNPRISGETIDMGAYEYQGNGVSGEELEVRSVNMSVYPNPFKPNERGHNSSIKFNLLESCNVDLTIYNMKGQKVKTMMDAYASRGEYNCRWNGSDDNGKPVSSGQYVLKLVVDDETKAVRKMIVFR